MCRLVGKDGLHGHVDFSVCPSRIQIKNSARKEILQACQESWFNGSKAIWTYSLLGKEYYKRVNGVLFLNQVFTGQGVFPRHILAFLARIPNARVEKPKVLFFMCSLRVRSGFI
ncbi:hypothetical protein AVEN_94812-1 [Araneus ventricosus]|uniref:Uncharacterized protein n=1 Tax=Araneus ventricosus TaxID=182803 RepID=A0A4Y2CMZ0_ARAVE|nr:hypothetical protein AVEN_94812-1 [Araneus ventricosus]